MGTRPHTRWRTTTAVTKASCTTVNTWAATSPDRPPTATIPGTTVPAAMTTRSQPSARRSAPSHRPRRTATGSRPAEGGEGEERHRCCTRGVDRRSRRVGQRLHRRRHDPRQARRHRDARYGRHRGRGRPVGNSCTIAASTGSSTTTSHDASQTAQDPSGQMATAGGSECVARCCREREPPERQLGAAAGEDHPWHDPPDGQRCLEQRPERVDRHRRVGGDELAGPASAAPAAPATSREPRRGQTRHPPALHGRAVSPSLEPIARAAIPGGAGHRPGPFGNQDRDAMSSRPTIGA